MQTKRNKKALWKFWQFALGLTIFIFMLPDISFGQAVYGSIFGTVTDAQGAAVPKANITITDLEKNLTFTTQTNASGNYTYARLVPGRYKVKIEAQGFKASVQDVVVNVDTASPANFRLETGALTEEVTVTAEAPLLKTDRADVATTFESRQVTDLPILDRNFTKLILLTPGTQQLQWQHAASENPQGSTQTMVNGQHFSGTGYQLDGTDNRDPILGIIVVNPNLESIGETKVTSQNYDAEFGQAIAGVVSVQTKSGSNEIHGSAFLFRQNDELQARNPFSQAARNAQLGKFIPDSLRNQFGGSVGGPILKDKLFFFGDYEGWRSKVGGSRLLSVPTTAARGGNLSSFGEPIFDPNPANLISTTCVNATTGATFPCLKRAQFAGGVIPTARISTQARNLLNLIPQSNVTGIDNNTRNNFVAGGGESFDKDSFNIRIDTRVSEKLNMFGRYSFADFLREGPTAFGAGGGPELVSLGGTSDVRNQSIAYGFDYTLSPTSVVDFRFGWFRYRVNVLPFDFGASTATDAGVPGLNVAGDDFTSGLFAGFIDRRPGDNLFSFGSGLGVNRCNCPLEQDEQQVQFVGNLTKFQGNHTFKFGADIRRAYNLRVPSDRHRSGELNFSGSRTSQAFFNPTTGTVITGDIREQGTNIAAGTGGLGLATFLLGDVTGFSRFVSPNTNARERQWRHFYYGQDTWRVTPKLTVNYGLRLDVINPQTLNEPGNGGFLDLDTGEILVAGVGNVDINGNIDNSLNLAPRASVAYKLTDKTVIRAGYGRSYDIGVFGSLFGHSVTQNLPVLAAQQLTAPSNFDRVFTLASGPPATTNFFGLNAAPNRGGTPNASLPASGRFFLPDGVFTRALPKKQTLPTVDAWNVTFQHQLTNTISVEAAYVGNKGTHVFAGDGPAIDANQATLEGFLQGVPRNNRRVFFNRFGWTQGIDFFCNCADNRYNALQTKVEKRFSNSWSLLAHYTYQRATQDGAELFFFDQDLNRGPADWDRTHIFVLTNLWELPFGKGKWFGGNASGAMDSLLGGWQLNTNTSISSGVPFNVGYNAGGNIDTGPNRPNINGDANTGGDRNRFFDPTVFSSPGPGQFGNLKRNALRGPGFFQTDASLFKKVKFTEAIGLEFRFEISNLFNHVNLGQPDAFLGNPANPQPNAGRITSTASNYQPRNVQWGLKLRF